MHSSLTLIVMVAGCGRIGFDPSASATDARLGDGGAGDGTMMIDGPDAGPAGAATVTYIGSANSVQDLATYTFSGQPIGPAAANRIIVVCAFLGGAAISPVTSITVNGTALGLSGSQVDPSSGTLVFGHGLIPTGTTGDITVTSATAGRAAIAVYNLTASSAGPAGGGGASSSSFNTTPISTLAVAQAGGVVIAIAGYGSNNSTWTWGGTWMGTEHLDAVWSEQGSYTTASAATASGGFPNVSATPQSPTGKLLSVASWR